MVIIMIIAIYQFLKHYKCIEPIRNYEPYSNIGSTILDVNKKWMEYLENDNLLISHNCYTDHDTSYAEYGGKNETQINSLPEYVKLFDKFNITRKDQFMDIGSGTGLMCFGMRKRYDFGKIIGIEHNKKQYDCSIKNLEMMKMDKISFVNSSFFDYNIPKTITFAYGFNPFASDIKAFEKAIDKLKGIDNLILVWMNIKLNDIQDILLKNTKSFETGTNVYPYIIAYF